MRRLNTYPVTAVKTGMLYCAGIIAAVCDELERLPRASRPALVVDPVMIASSGDPLLQPFAVKEYEERLLPLAALVTPNLDEAAALTGRNLVSLADLRTAGSELAQRYGVPFLIKGGHLRGESPLTSCSGRVGPWSLPHRSCNALPPMALDALTLRQSRRNWPSAKTCPQP